MSQQTLRDEFLATLAHIGNVLTKVTQNSGPNGFLSAPDLHKLAEGLFLSAWTHWEQFAHYLLVEDLATVAGSKVHRSVRQFRTAGAAWRLANQLLTHPDHPQKFIEWSDYATVVSRANEFLVQAIVSPQHHFRVAVTLNCSGEFAMPLHTEVIEPGPAFLTYAVTPLFQCSRTK